MLRWETTAKCNLRCAHCCVADWMANPDIRDLSHEEFTEALDKVAKAGVKYIHFLGGEPTIRPRFLDLLEYARSKGMEVSYNTNGIRQDDRLIDTIFDLDLAQVTISIDGLDAESNDRIRGKGAYERATRCAQKIADKRKKLGTSRPAIWIQMVLNRLWYEHADASLDLASSLDADGLVINNLAIAGSAVSNASWLSLTYQEEFEAAGKVLLGMTRHPQLHVRAPVRAKVVQYYREVTGLDLPVSPYECLGLKTSAYIYSDGTIAPCMIAHMQGMANGLDVPNIAKADLQDGWNFAYFDRFAGRVFGDPKIVYAEQEPCNRCFFLGKICTPCPLSINPDETPTMYPCLIAEALIEKGHRLGGHQHVSDAMKADIIRATLTKAIGPPPAVEI